MAKFICPHCGYDDFEIIDDQLEFRIHVCHACNETYEVNRTAEEIAEIEAEQAAVADVGQTTYITTNGDGFVTSNDLKQRCPSCHKEIDYSSYLRNTGGWVVWRCQHCDHEWMYSFNGGKR